MLGDLGTLIPLLVGMAKVRMTPSLEYNNVDAQIGSIQITPALFWMGVFNIISSYQWDLPMPVQPMKMIAATAISDGLTKGEVREICL